MMMIAARSRETREDNPGEPFDQGLASARANGRRVYEIACGHDIMLDKPERLAELLQGLSR
jgi:hypothetical protein